MDRVGNDSAITIEESKGFTTELDVVEGSSSTVDMYLLTWFLKVPS